MFGIVGLGRLGARVARYANALDMNVITWSPNLTEPKAQEAGARLVSICALFDLALLKVYESAPFFHFVYHDGVLEGLDDRKKIAFLGCRSRANRGQAAAIHFLDDRFRHAAERAR
jgi:uncharacterized protein YydD (DUF2326 family)